MNTNHNIMLARPISVVILLVLSSVCSVASAQENDTSLLKGDSSNKGDSSKDISKVKSSDPTDNRLPAIEVGENFKTENLIPWCMVAFDAKQRSARRTSPNDR